MNIELNGFQRLWLVGFPFWVVGWFYVLVGAAYKFRVGLGAVTRLALIAAALTLVAGVANADFPDHQRPWTLITYGIKADGTKRWNVTVYSTNGMCRLGRDLFLHNLKDVGIVSDARAECYYLKSMETAT